MLKHVGLSVIIIIGGMIGTATKELSTWAM